ncbi:MAG: hypothetical protein JST54_32025 [Deltaproteobacteria bacterium]|nr:hypothetical protein [Deltaproteobacteria bacterium]
MVGLARGRTLALAGLVAAGLVSGCGREGETTANATNSSIGPTDYTFVIGPQALSAEIASVPAGGRVTFLNTDVVGHQIASNGPRALPDCPELDGPPIPPQGSYTFIMADHAETCGFHDVFLPTVSVSASSAVASAPVVQGTIIVGSVKSTTTVVVPGGNTTNVVAP